MPAIRIILTTISHQSTKHVLRRKTRLAYLDINQSNVISMEQHQLLKVTIMLQWKHEKLQNA